MNLVCRLLVITALPLVLVGGTLAQRPKQSNQEFLQAKLDRLVNYQTDLRAFAEAITITDERSVLESRILGDLQAEAQKAIDYLFAVRAFLSIYDQLTCQADRAKVWLVIKREMDYYVLQLDNNIVSINNGLSLTKMAAVATSGTQMKEDIREVKTFLTSLKP